MPYRKANKADAEEALRKVDWAALDALSDEELTKAAEADPDNPPLSDAELERLASAARVKRVRQAVGLSQPAFSERFRIPLATLRDWEHGRRVPDAATQAYLTVIEKNPEAVADALDAA